MSHPVLVRLLHRILTGNPIYMKVLTTIGLLLFFGSLAGLVWVATRAYAWLG